jgi:drug/metabolite transporter (DMT)-like permease
VRLAPCLFIFIWASGYLAAKYALPYAEPLTFLSLRYFVVAGMMLLVTVATGSNWPSCPSQYFHISVAGILIQAGYLGGVWCAIALGMPAGIAALIVNCQPLLTAMFARSVGEKVGLRQWAGLLLGLAGVALVVSNKVSTTGLSTPSIVLSVFALVAITSGVLYQKRYCPAINARSGQVIQFGASFLVTLPFALVLEENNIQWTGEFVAALLWSVIVLSGVGMSLLYFMIRNGAATQVTSYLYLVPPVTAILAYGLFGEVLSPLAVLGMLVTVAAVALVVRPLRSPQPRLDPVRP